MNELSNKNMDIPPTPFDSLVQNLKNCFEDPGDQNEKIQADHLQSLMRAYASKRSEWDRFALGDPDMAYTRNLVDKGNGKYNLVRQRRLLHGLKQC
jgi:cysteine dioxygenase